MNKYVFIILFIACFIVGFSEMLQSDALAQSDNRVEMVNTPEEVMVDGAEKFEDYSTGKLFVHLVSSIESYWKTLYELLVGEDGGYFVKKMMTFVLLSNLIYLSVVVHT